MSVYPGIASVLDSAGRIPEERRRRLEEVAGCLDGIRPLRLLFICTHNSRRSQLAQVWAAAAAHDLGAGGVETFSGGTEVTAVHPNVLEALRQAGFHIEETRPGPNPVHAVRYSGEASPVELWSKRFDDPANPSAEFCAVMTCSEADAACPSVPGADFRIALPYDDPKVADGTGNEASVYAARSLEIAREMAWVFGRLAG